MAIRTLVISALALLVGFPLLDCGEAVEGEVEGGGDEWQALEPLQIARQETGAAHLAGKFYVVGGLLAGSPLRATASVEVYDLAQGQWAFGDPLPVVTGLDHMAVAATGGRLFVMGGYSADFQARDELWIYDPQMSQWLPGAPLPDPRGASWAVEHDGKIYLFGGTNASGSATRTTFIYDPTLNQWSPGSDMPTRREHLNAVAAGPYIYVIGGRNGPSTGANERYDPEHNTWTSLAPMPTARSAMALGVVGGFIYAAGGEVPMLFAVNQVYEIAGNQWATDTPMAVPRHGVAAVSLAGHIFAPGGGTVQGLAPTTYVDRFVPGGPSGVEDAGGVAPALPAVLHPNLPNPFGPSTAIRFSLASPAPIRLTIYDTQGRRVRALLAAPLGVGAHVVGWDGRDDAGIARPSGVYLLRLATPAATADQKLILTR